MTPNIDIYDWCAPEDSVVAEPTGMGVAKHWLPARGLEPEQALVQLVLRRAKRGRGVVPDPEVLQIVQGDLNAHAGQE